MPYSAKGTIYFPKGIRPASPCKTFTSSHLERTPHGVVKVIVTHQMKDYFKKNAVLETLRNN